MIATGTRSTRVEFLSDDKMILAVEVSYRGCETIAGRILFRDSGNREPEREFGMVCRTPESYIPGRFRRRELPCIIAMLKEIARQSTA